MPLPEHKTMMKIKEEVLGKLQIRGLEENECCGILANQIDNLLIQAYNQGTLCQHSSHGNRVGHFEEFVGTKTKDAKEL
jgi:hypothetical protein